MEKKLLDAFTRDIPAAAMRRNLAAELAACDAALAGRVALAFPPASDKVGRNILRFLVLSGGRAALAAHSALYLKETARRPLFHAVLREAGLAAVNAMVDLARRLPPDGEGEHAACRRELHAILRETGHYDRLTEFLDHDQEKVILYALRQFYLFPAKETLDLLRPVGAHPNWLVRHNILEIFLRLSGDEARHAALDFLDDPEKKIRDRIRDEVRRDLAAFYPVLVRRFENTLDLKFNTILSLLGEVGRTDLLDRLVHYVVAYKRPLNVRALETFTQILARETRDFGDPFNPDGRHRRLAIHLRTLLLSAGPDTHAGLAQIVRKLGDGGMALLLREYDGSGSLEAENIESVYRALRDEDDAARLAAFVGRGVEPETVNLLRLMRRKIGDPPLLTHLFRLIESLPVESVDALLALTHGTFPEFPAFREGILQLVDRSGEPERRLALLRFLGTIGDPKLLENLDREMDHEDEAHRIEILGLLGRFHSVEAVAVLKKAVGDARPAVRKALLDALCGIDNLEATVMLFYVFREEIERGDADVASLIAERGKERFFRHLGGMNEFFRKELGQTLANLSESFVDDVAADLSSLNFDERSRALELLTLISENRRDEVLVKLRTLLNDPDDRMRAMLARTLAAIGGDEVADFAVSLLDDPNPRVRANAIEILPLLHDADLYAHVYRFLKDENNRVRANAVMTLYRAGDRRVVLALADMLKSEEKWMRASAAFAIGELGDERLTPLLVGSIADPDPDVRRNAVKSLGKCGDTSCVKHLLPLLSREDKSLYDEASRAIAAIRRREANS